MLFRSSKSTSEPPEPARSWAVVLIATISALLVVLLLVALAPRFVAGYMHSWTVTTGAAVLAFITVLAIGFIRRARYQVTRRAPQDGTREVEEHST